MRSQVFAQEKSQLQNLLSEHSNVGIIVGAKQTLDTVGASLALYLSLLDAGKQAQIVSPVEPLVEISNLVGIDQIKTKFEGDTRTVVISVPYKEGEVEKVSFTTEGDRMNFNIVGGAQGITPFDTKDIRILRKGSTPELIIAIGIPQIEELSSMVDTSGNVKIVNIDNSQNNTFYGDIIMTDPGFSSVSEIVTSIIDELGLPLDVDTAQNLLDGISYATNNFASPQTSSFAFESTGVLLRVGAQRHSIATHEAQKLPRDFGQPRVQQSQQVRPTSPVVNQPIPSYSQDYQAPLDMNNQPEENKSTEEVPSDWFVPKVFKGSKNPNQ